MINPLENEKHQRRKGRPSPATERWSLWDDAQFLHRCHLIPLVAGCYRHCFHCPVAAGVLDPPQPGVGRGSNLLGENCDAVLFLYEFPGHQVRRSTVSEESVHGRCCCHHLLVFPGYSANHFRKLSVWRKKFSKIPCQVQQPSFLLITPQKDGFSTQFRQEMSQFSCDLLSGDLRSRHGSGVLRPKLDGEIPV